MIQEEADRVRLERKAKMREIKENISNRYGLLVIIMVNRISARSQTKFYLQRTPLFFIQLFQLYLFCSFLAYFFLFCYSLWSISNI